MAGSLRGWWTEASNGSESSSEALFKSPEWYILRSKICVLVTVNDILSTESDKKCLNKTCIVLLILDICEGRGF